MWAKFLARLREPSTAAGVAAVILGAGQLAKVREAPALADLVTQAGAVAVADPVLGAVALVAGLVAMFRKEGGK